MMDFNKNLITKQNMIQNTFIQHIKPGSSRAEREQSKLWAMENSPLKQFFQRTLHKVVFSRIHFSNKNFDFVQKYLNLFKNKGYIFQDDVRAKKRSCIYAICSAAILITVSWIKLTFYKEERAIWMKYQKWWNFFWLVNQIAFLRLFKAWSL